MDQLRLAREEHGDDRFFDLGFRAVQADPIGEVRRLYGWLGEPVSDEFEAGMRRWWDDHAEGREQNTHPDPSEFGLDLNEVRDRFADYLAAMPRWVAWSAEARGSHPW